MNAIANFSPDMNRERLVGTKAAAEFLDISIPHLRRLYRTNKVPAPIRIGDRKYAWRLGALIDCVSAKAGAGGYQDA